MSKYEYPIGRHVECDVCSADLTDDVRSGGITYFSYAAGPCCAPRMEARMREYGELGDISGRCPPDMTFADWVRDVLRGGKSAAITIYTDDDANAFFRSTT